VTCDMRASNSLIGGVTGGGKGRRTGRQRASVGGTGVTFTLPRTEYVAAPGGPLGEAS
jgi:hypothetical protein